jgi:hypothetical protein
MPINLNVINNVFWYSKIVTSIILLNVNIMLYLMQQNVLIVICMLDRDSSMVDQQVAGIKTYLASASLHASPEWVEGCVEFFISEHHDQRVSLLICCQN